MLDDRWAEPSLFKFQPAPAPRKALEGHRLGCGPNLSGGGPRYRVEHAGAPVVRETLQHNGLNQTQDRDWVIQWSGPGLRDQAYSELAENQRVNHFPGSTELTRKDRLWFNFADMAKTFGEEDFDFVPRTYVLPDQVEEFLKEYESSNSLWIVKPHAASQGKGIFLLKDLDELPLSEMTVVCRYVDNPLLIQGLKFDLRVYVLVTGYDPLRIYMYREGLVRFASQPYSTDKQHLSDVYRHLTNYSINKSAKNFVENAKVLADNVGHKWSFSALNKHLRCTGVDVDRMWAGILDLTVKTLVGVAPSIAAKTRSVTNCRYNCFELYGFDIMVDDTLKAWLLEVNLSPSMSADSPLDWHIKSALITDAFNLVGICRDPFSAAAGRRACQARPCRSELAVDELLENLGTDELKTLAHALSESSRVTNFIRLHPTSSTVERYGGLVAHTGELSSSERLAALLLGPSEAPPRPQSAGLSHSCAPLVATAGGLARQRPASASRALARSRPRAASAEGRGSSPDRPRPHSAAASCSSSATARSIAASRVSSVASMSRTRAAVDATALLQSQQVMVAAALARGASVSPQRAWARLKVLGRGTATRLLLMDYLSRLHDLCVAVGHVQWKLALTPTVVGHMVALCNSLKDRVKSSPESPSSRSLSASSPLKGDVITAVVSCARRYLDVLARDLEVNPTEDGINDEDGGDFSELSPCSAGPTSALARLLPQDWSRTPSVRRALAATSGLGAADLEALLLGPRCDSELRWPVLSGLGQPTAAARPVQPEHPKCGSLRPPWPRRRPRSALGKAQGVLCELLSSVERAALCLQGVQPDLEPVVSDAHMRLTPQRPCSAPFGLGRADAVPAGTAEVRRRVMPQSGGLGGFCGGRDYCGSRGTTRSCRPSSAMARCSSAPSDTTLRLGGRNVTLVPEGKMLQARARIQQHIAAKAAATEATAIKAAGESAVRGRADGRLPRTAKELAAAARPPWRGPATRRPAAASAADPPTSEEESPSMLVAALAKPRRRAPHGFSLSLVGADIEF